MPWVRLDDGYDEHPKVASVGPLGRDLWVAGLAYCNRNLTDGFIPWAKARTLVSTEWVAPDGSVMCLHVSTHDGVREATTKDAIGLLVSAGLWEEAEGGYVVHDYADFQPTKDQVESEREQKRTAGQAGGKASAQARAQARAQAPGKANAQANAEQAPKQTASGMSSKTQAEPQAKSKPVPVPVPVPVSPYPDPVPDRKQEEKEMPVTGAVAEKARPDDGKPPDEVPATAPSGLVSSSTSPSGPEPEHPPSVDAMIGRVASRKALEPDPPEAVEEAERRRERNRELAEELRKRQEAAS